MGRINPPGKVVARGSFAVNVVRPLSMRRFEHGVIRIECSRRVIPCTVRGRASEDKILFAKNTGGGKLEGTAHSLDELSFDFTIMPRLQESITEPSPPLQLND